MWKIIFLTLVSHELFYVLQLYIVWEDLQERRDGTQKVIFG